MLEMEVLCFNRSIHIPDDVDIVTVIQFLVRFYCLVLENIPLRNISIVASSENIFQLMSNTVLYMQMYVCILAL